MFKVNNRNTRCWICSKLTIKTPERGQWRHSAVFIINYKHTLQLFLMFLFLTLNKWMLAGSCYSCAWLNSKVKLFNTNVTKMNPEKSEPWMSYCVSFFECCCKRLLLVFQSNSFDLNSGITSIILICIILTFLGKLCYVLGSYSEKLKLLSL